MLELEEFKIEIKHRFKKSKFNHTFVFPRKSSEEQPKVLNYHERTLSRSSLKAHSSFRSKNNENSSQNNLEEKKNCSKVRKDKLNPERIVQQQNKRNSGENLKCKIESKNYDSLGSRGQMKSSKIINKISFGKPPSCSDQVKTKVMDLSSVVKDRNLIHSQTQSISSSRLMKPKYQESTYDLSGNNTMMGSQLGSQNQNKNDKMKGKAFSSQSTLKYNINALSQIISGPTKKINQPNSAREIGKSLQNSKYDKEFPVNYPYRREAGLKREMDKLMSNYSQNSYNKKKDSLKKSTS